MELLPYNQFAALRMRDLWPPGVQVAAYESLESAIGFSDGEKVGWSYFGWPPERWGEVAEVRLEAIGAGPDECRHDIAAAVFAAVRLPLRPEITLEEAAQLLGEPVEPVTRSTALDLDFAEFRCGETWPYRVRCAFQRRDGLVSVIIVREDLSEPR